VDLIEEPSDERTRNRGRSGAWRSVFRRFGARGGSHVVIKEEIHGRRVHAARSNVPIQLVGHPQRDEILRKNVAAQKKFVIRLECADRVGKRHRHVRYIVELFRAQGLTIFVQRIARTDSIDGAIEPRHQEAREGKARIAGAIGEAELNFRALEAVE